MKWDSWKKKTQLPHDTWVVDQTSGFLGQWRSTLRTLCTMHAFKHPSVVENHKEWTEKKSGHILKSEQIHPHAYIRDVSSRHTQWDPCWCYGVLALLQGHGERGDKFSPQGRRLNHLWWNLCSWLWSQRQDTYLNEIARLHGFAKKYDGPNFSSQWHLETARKRPLGQYPGKSVGKI